MNELASGSRYGQGRVCLGMIASVRTETLQDQPGSFVLFRTGPLLHGSFRSLWPPLDCFELSGDRGIQRVKIYFTPIPSQTETSQRLLEAKNFLIFCSKFTISGREFLIVVSAPIVPAARAINIRNTWPLPSHMQEPRKREVQDGRTGVETCLNRKGPNKK